LIEKGQEETIRFWWWSDHVTLGLRFRLGGGSMRLRDIGFVGGAES